MADDLSSNREFRKLWDAVRRLQNTTMLQDASVSQGRLRFIGGLLRVDSGGRVEIVGTLQIDGQTIVSGTFDVEGPWTLAGAGDITGDVGVTGDVTARTGGKFRAEGGPSPATLADGSLTFDSGGQVEADTANGGVRVRAGDAVVNVGDVSSLRKGSTSVIVGPLGVTLNAPTGQEILLQGALRASALTTAPAGTSTVPLVYAPSTGRIHRGS